MWYAARMAIKEFTRRWRGRSKTEVSTSMSALATRRAKKMSKVQRVAHSRMMLAKRGSHWKVDAVSGRRVYF